MLDLFLVVHMYYDIISMPLLVSLNIAIKPNNIRKEEIVLPSSDTFLLDTSIRIQTILHIPICLFLKFRTTLTAFAFAST